MNKTQERDEARHIARMYEQWLKNRNSGIDMGVYLSYHNYKKVAIYGYGVSGSLLYDEIKDTVESCFAIDRAAWRIHEERINVYLPKDAPKDVDLVIVTALFDFHHIKKELETTFSCPIVSLQEIICDTEAF